MTTPGRPRIAIVLQRYLDYADRAVAGIVSYPNVHERFELREFPDSPEAKPVHFPKSWPPDGIIAGIGPDKPVLDSLLSVGVPVVNLSNDWPPTVMPAIPHDLRSMAQLAAAHFKEIGCQRVILVRVAQVDTQADRIRRLSEPFAEAGLQAEVAYLPREPGYHGDDPLEPADAPESLIQALQQLPKPLGLWGRDDIVGEYLCRLCRHLHLNIPNDVAILGVSDTSICRVSDPPLSSIRLPNERQGYEAVALMERLLRGEPWPAEPLRIPVTVLVPRQSTIGEDDLHDSIDEAIRFIAEHACEGIKVTDVLQNLRMSRVTLEKRFQNKLGRAPGEEIRRVRFERAKELLGQTDLSIGRIAGMVGFESVQRFGEFFRRQSRQTPSAFRRDARAARQTDNSPIAAGQ